MRYKLPIDRSVNRLVPHYLSGRRFILFVQSCLYPLQSLNERFRTFARERHIEARMTSQVIYFEWFLNYRFGKYIKDGKDRIFIKDSTSVGVDLYHEGAEYQRPFTVWYNGEQVTTDNEAERPRPFYLLAEEKLINKVSFMVCVPPVTIPPRELVYMLSYVVNTYKTAGKTYLIKIDEDEYPPPIRIQDNERIYCGNRRTVYLLGRYPELAGTGSQHECRF